MTYTFIAFDQILAESEKSILDFLYDYKLLDKFVPDVKKVFLYFLIHRINEYLKDRKVLIYHNSQISDTHELLEYFPKDKVDQFCNKLCNKIKKITKRLFYVTNVQVMPTKGNIEMLDGEIIEEVVLLNNEEPDYKVLKDFLHKNRLTDMFRSIH